MVAVALLKCPVALDIERRPKATPVHELERYMRSKLCSEERGCPYKRSHLVALRTTKVTVSDRRRRGGRETSEMKKVAIGRVVQTNREHIISLEPLNKGLMGTLLRYPYEVRSEEEYFDDIQDVKVTKDSSISPGTS